MQYHLGQLHQLLFVLLCVQFRQMLHNHPQQQIPALILLISNEYLLHPLGLAQHLQHHLIQQVVHCLLVLPHHCIPATQPLSLHPVSQVSQVFVVLVDTNNVTGCGQA